MFKIGDRVRLAPFMGSNLNQILVIDAITTVLDVPIYNVIELEGLKNIGWYVSTSLEKIKCPKNKPLK